MIMADLGREVNSLSGRLRLLGLLSLLSLARPGVPSPRTGSLAEHCQRLQYRSLAPWRLCSVYLVCSVCLVYLVWGVRRFLSGPEMIMAVLLAWVYISSHCFRRLGGQAYALSLTWPT